MPNAERSPRVIVTSHALGWRGIALESYFLGPATKPVKVLPSHFLGIVRGRSCEIEWRVSGRLERRRLLPGQFWLMPSGVDASMAWSAWHSTIRYALNPAQVERVAKELGGPERELSPCTVMKDSSVTRILDSLHAEAMNPGAATSLLADALSTELALRLLRAPVPSTTRAASRLSSAQLRKTREFIEAHLAGTLDLASLARTAGLSSFHFAHAFRASTGIAPHQYVTERRLERAKLLLVRSGGSIVAVAQSVGFESPSHFAKIFARAVGMSPSAWRRAAP